MRRLPAAALLALLALLLPGLAGPSPALAHGASTMVERTEGPYHVRIYVFEQVTENEFVRIGWDVRLAASDEPVALDQPLMRVRHRDLDGRLVKDENVSLVHPRPGIFYTDLQLGPRGSVNYTLPLPEAEVDYGQPVCWFTESFAVRCGKEEADSPSPALAVPLGLALAALALRRRARR